jgi:hypothetical protein
LQLSWNPQLISFFVDGISIPGVVQASKSDVRGAFVDSLGQLRGLMSSGTFPAIVSLSNIFFAAQTSTVICLIFSYSSALIAGLPPWIH